MRLVSDSARALPAPITDQPESLDAVKATLTALADAAHAAARSPRTARQASARIRDGALDCVAALERIQATLRRESEHCRTLESEASHARAALQRASTELARCQAKERGFRELSLHDALTALPNRRFFLERLERAVADAVPRRSTLAVLYLDLDDFKTINDLHGHAMGDRLLQVVAARLLGQVREGDMMSRLGGDEFACLIVRPSGREELGKLARKLFASASAPITLGAHSFTVRPSIGIATYPANGAHAAALIECADRAMYFAKQHRTGHAFYDGHLLGISA